MIGNSDSFRMICQTNNRTNEQSKRNEQRVKEEEEKQANCNRINFIGTGAPILMHNHDVLPAFTIVYMYFTCSSILHGGIDTLSFMICRYLILYSFFSTFEPSLNVK